jgi:hypothetical protein
MTAPINGLIEARGESGFATPNKDLLTSINIYTPILNKPKQLAP